MENDASREAAITEFHTVLSDVSYGHCTESVKKFIVQSYVRGARFGSAESCPLEKVTSVFTKRRYRDAWNRALMRKIVSMAVPLTIMLRLLEESLEKTPQRTSRVSAASAKTHNHSVKVRGMCRPKGQRGSCWCQPLFGSAGLSDAARLLIDEILMHQF